MPRITYISPDGTRKEVEVENGYSVMEGAINNNIEGIVAECGGACACATCHSYVDEAWLDKLAPIDDMEDSMLDAAFERKANSRLTCQIEVSDKLGAKVRVEHSRKGAGKLVISYNSLDELDGILKHIK